MFLESSERSVDVLLLSPYSLDTEGRVVSTCWSVVRVVCSRSRVSICQSSVHYISQNIRLTVADPGFRVASVYLVGGASSPKAVMFRKFVGKMSERKTLEP